MKYYFLDPTTSEDKPGLNKKRSGQELERDFATS